MKLARTVAAFSVALIAASTVRATPTFATAGEAARDAEGLIDVDATIAALVRLGATEYLYDLPADSDSWARLPRFAEEAARQKIGVYVYLAPPSQARKGGKNRQDGPFGLDYVAWADAIATLARDRTAIRGIVIDDFATNVGDDKFTPQMLDAMRQKLRAAGRPLTVKPVLYFDQPIDQLLETFAPQFADGVVMCYPRGEREVDVTLAYLRDAPRGAALATEISKRRHLQKGGGTTARTILRGEQARDAVRMSFFVDTRDLTPEHGRQRLLIRADGREIWRGELPRARRDDRDVSVELPRLRDGTKIEVQVLVESPPADAEEEVVARITFDEVRFLDARGRAVADVFWEGEASAGSALYVSPQREAGRPTGPRWSIPMTLLVAGSPRMHEKTFFEAATPAAIAGRTGDAMRWARKRDAQGVISWALPLDESAASRAIREELRRAVR